MLDLETDEELQLAISVANVCVLLAMWLLIVNYGFRKYYKDKLVLFAIPIFYKEK